MTELPRDVTPSAREIIEALGLKPHPEGGWYAETFRDESAAPRGHSTESTTCSKPDSARTGTASRTRRRSGISMPVTRWLSPRGLDPSLMHRRAGLLVRTVRNGTTGMDTPARCLGNTKLGVTNPPGRRVHLRLERLVCINPADGLSIRSITRRTPTAQRTP